MSEILTLEEVAEKLKISEQTVRRYLRENKITGFKLGNNWRVKEEELMKFIDEQTVTD